MKMDDFVDCLVDGFSGALKLGCFLIGVSLGFGLLLGVCLTVLRVWTALFGGAS
jgi:hypothetical protein